MRELVKDLEKLQAIAFSDDCTLTPEGYSLLERIIKYEKAKPEEDREDLRRLWELESLINNPEIEEFLKGVKLEAAHQTDKWGIENELAKSPVDYALVMDKLKGKLALSIWDGDIEKYKHHLITLAAVCSNVHSKFSDHRSNVFKYFNL